MSKKVSKVLADAEKVKTKQYVDLGLLSGDVFFVPFIQDLTGNLGSKADAFLGKLQDCSARLANFKSAVKTALTASLVVSLSKTAAEFNSGFLDGTFSGV